MSALRKIIRPGSGWWLAIVLAGIGSLMANPAAGAWLTARPFNEKVVIDPGHGGQDRGAKGLTGTLEKDVTLAMAAVLKSELEKYYRVTLTRNADYGLPVDDRVSLANHLKADLFISLHSGASFSSESSGITVFYCRLTPETDFSTTPQPPLGGTRPDSWHQIYLRHQQASQRFSRLVRDQFKQRLGASVTLQGLPLRVLLGANMPAVLIEIGSLTHPVDEKELRDSNHLNDLAKALHAAIDRFFHHP